MPFIISDVGNDVVSSMAKKFRPLVKNAVTTSIVIVIVLIIIVMFTYESENGVVKMAFWTILVTIVILLVHDTAIADEELKKRDEQRVNEVTYKYPEAMQKEDHTIGKKEEFKINLPPLSINTRPTNPDFHNLSDHPNKSYHNSKQ